MTAKRSRAAHRNDLPGEYAPPRAAARKPAPLDRALPASADAIVAALRSRPAEVAAALRGVRVQLSGRYTCNGGASVREGRGFRDAATGVSRTALRDPSYVLDRPVYLEDGAEGRRGASSGDARRGNAIRFTLHVDVDGPDALGVVSGTVARGAAVTGRAAPHFIGRVVEDRPTGDGRELAVEGMEMRWPRSASRIDRVEIRLAGSAIATPSATVLFRDTVRRTAHGPFVAVQQTAWFREVEVDVDRERDAMAAEPYRARAHPDRPRGLADETLTLESVFARAGIRIARDAASGDVIETAEARRDGRWSYVELHDSMERHWQAFADRPQWKMWIFLANLAHDPALGGVMFDGDIDEPGGVDRQGTALFTRCPYFHTEEGEYCAANPPAREAAQRELFFNLVHETGHAFNLAHSFDKQLEQAPGEHAWSPPPWMPLRADAQALSFMNYPDSATPTGDAGANATWFYRRFRWRFDDSELLFLRHAPESYVQMGNAAWFQNHGRVSRRSVDRRLELILRTRKPTLELGEAVFVEMRLGLAPGVAEPVMAHANLSPSDGFVELAVTGPDGQRRPFIPIAHTRRRVQPHRFLPDAEKLYYTVNMTAGLFGFAFKAPGPYRVEASYRNLDGRTAANVIHLEVLPAPSVDGRKLLGTLRRADVARTLFVGGTRMIDEVNDRLDFVAQRLGTRHPASYWIASARAKPLAGESRSVDPRTRKVDVAPPEPEHAMALLAPLVEQADAVADSLGHMRFRSTMDLYTDAAELARARPRARDAQRTMLGLFERRGVVQSVCDSVARRVRTLA